MKKEGAKKEIVKVSVSVKKNGRGRAPRYLFYLDYILEPFFKVLEEVELINMKIKQD